MKSLVYSFPGILNLFYDIYLFDYAHNERRFYKLNNTHTTAGIHVNVNFNQYENDLILNKKKFLTNKKKVYISYHNSRYHIMTLLP